MLALHSLRKDLEFSEQSHQSQSFLVVKDPVTDRYFRFKESQAAILELLRSPTDLENLSANVSSKLGGHVKRESLEAFIRSLDQKWLLDTPTTQEFLGELRGRRPHEERNVLYLKLFTLDAESAFRWLLPRVRWCFTPLFHVFALATIAIGFAITTMHAGELFEQLFSLLSVYGLLTVSLVVLVVTGLHEFAHGLTCSHFGGRVRRVGFMLIYFTPALYCDVSDAWMLSSKRQRVWVTFAGGYFQLVVWGCAAVVWRITAQETLISNLALAAVTFGGTQTLLNFNPLIKLDGYYMLSDYLEIPNLREKAFRAFHAWLALRPDPLLSSQARRPLLTYAVLAVAFSMLLLGVVYANIYWFATTHFQFAGLVAFIFFMGLTLKRAATEPAAGARALATRAVLKKYRTFGVVAIILLAMLIPWELRIAAEFEVLPNEESIVRSETAGTISAIHVREGSRVEREEVLAELVDFARARELSQVVGNLGQKEAELALLVAGPRPEEIAQAQRLVETRQTELDNVRRNIQEGNRLREELAARQAEVRLAERELDQARLLFADGLGPRFDVERWEETVEIRTRAMNATATGLEILAETNDREGDLKSRELAQAESDLTLLMAGSRNEEIDQRRAEVSALRRQEAILKEELEKNLIRAPIAGTVVTPFIERLQNQHFDPGDEFARIVEVDQVTASLLVPEKELAEVRIGSRVVLKARSYPASDFEGTVRVIAPVAQDLSAGRFVEVRTTLDNPDGALRPEMTGVAKIYAGRRLVFQLMSRRIVRWFRTEFWDLLP